MNYKLLIIFLFVLCSGCTLFGSKVSPSELENACKSALKETSMFGDIELFISGSSAPVTGTFTGKLANDAKPIQSGILGNGNGSMILKLLNMTWIFLVIQVLITWGITILLKLRGSQIKLLNVSILVNLLIILATAVMIFAFGWIKSHPVDVFGTQIFGWGIQSLLYDSVIKKIITNKKGSV